MNKLPKAVRKAIESKLDSFFDAVKRKIFGYKGGDKILTIAGIYTSAIREEGGVPDPEDLENVTDSASKYVDALKLKSFNQIVNDVETHLDDPKATPATLNEALTDSWVKTSANAKAIVESTVQNSRNLGLLRGLSRVAAELKIEDPVIFFIVTKDDKTCPICIRLHLMPDKITPRCWYLSELTSGYLKKGATKPSMSGAHPSCRCLPVGLLPSYGFKDGKMTFISVGHDELKKQRS